MSRLHAVIIEVTDGNVRNHHFYLREVMSMFPSDAVGGSNTKERAAREICVRYPGFAAETDIDGEKKLFRDRASVRHFFEDQKVKGGDLLLIEKLGDYEFAVSKTARRIVNNYL